MSSGESGEYGNNDVACRVCHWKHRERTRAMVLLEGNITEVAASHLEAGRNAT
jgi:hypothetical protein